jgi:hypothetical protein
MSSGTSVPQVTNLFSSAAGGVSAMHFVRTAALVQKKTDMKNANREQTRLVHGVRPIVPTSLTAEVQQYHSINQT